MFNWTFLLLLLVGAMCGRVLGGSSYRDRLAKMGLVVELNDGSYFDENTTVAKNVTNALVKAAKYLMRQRNADYSWGAFTPRAVAALSFARRLSPVAVNEKELMEKQLNVQLLLDLMQNQGNMSISKLALYINALYATCQDPRHFQGVDLVAKLRSYTNKAMDSDSSLPLAFLTLCLAGERDQRDVAELGKLYNKETERLGSKALIVMTIICYKLESTFVGYFDHFFHDRQVETDVYTKALFMQALLAAGKPIDVQSLLNKQLPDGSFGDVLATYYAIPVLTNSTLLDLKCSSTKHAGMQTGNLMVKGNGEEQHVAYSLWISGDTNNEVKSHRLTVTYHGKKSFFEVMLMAAAKDPLFRFLYDKTNNEKHVYSISGIPNDSESRKSWILYSGTIGKVSVNSLRNLTKERNGVDRIFPKDKSHFVFWLKRGQAYAPKSKV